MTRIRIFFVFWIAVALAVGVAAQPAKRTVNIGIFQGGDYVPQGALREAFRTQLEAVLPDSIEAVFVADLFKSAAWDRQISKTYARELAQSRQIDLVVAIGPWVVEDLLEAGFTKPILAMYQPTPQFQGLLDASGRPIASNLTVTYSPNDLEDDLLLLTGLAKVKKLGVLYFPSLDSASRLLDEINAIGKELGFEAVYGEGYDNVGTYTYFKGYSQLDTAVDAVYLMPTWGFEGKDIQQLAERLLNDRRPSLTWEGRYPVEWGILASGSGMSFTAMGRFNAWKALRIFQGETPANLPTVLPDEQLVTINEATARKLKVQLPFEVLGLSEMVGVQPNSSDQRLTLNEAVERALANNPGYQAKRDAIMGSAARASEAWSTYMPQISLEGSAEYLSDNAAHDLTAIVNDPAAVKNERLRGALTVDQKVFSLETIREIKSAAAEKGLSQLESTRSELDLELAVTLAYLNRLRTFEVEAIYQKQRLLVNHALELAQARVATGEIGRAEADRWRAQRLAATNKLIAARADAYAAGVLLNALLNQPAETAWQLDSMPASAETFWIAYQRFRPYLATPAVLRSTQEKLLAHALQQNPSMQTARAEIDVQKKRLDRNWAILVPSLGLRGSLFYADQYADVPSSFEEKETGWSLGATLRWSLFDGGKRARVREGLTARISELEYTRDDVSLEVMHQIHTLTSRLAHLAGQAVVADRLNERALEQINSALTTYSAGKETYLLPLDAAELAETAQGQFTATKYEYLTTAAKLVHQLGISPYSQNAMYLQALYAFLRPSSEGP